MSLIAVNGTRMDPAFIQYRVLYNSQTFNVGDLVESLSTGYAKNPSAATAALGVIVGFTDVSNSPIQPADVTKSTTAYNGSVNQVVADADNTTVAQKKAMVCVDPSVLWSAAVNGTIGTTASSNLPSVGIDIDSANTNYGRVLESTATRTAATKTNFMAFGADPNDSTRLLVQLNCSEIFSSAKG